ncbi:hypothetical protein [Streptomyces sp. NPDC050538]|uniref:hypothetical protein n=1 Tax=Streptomyces sp. NPDC050538 TaxID=3365627 RepID=UPI0037B46332
MGDDRKGDVDHDRLGGKTCTPSVTRSPPTEKREEAESGAAPDIITSTMAYAPDRKRE